MELFKSRLAGLGMAATCSSRRECFESVAKIRSLIRYGIDNNIGLLFISVRNQSVFNQRNEINQLGSVRPLLSTRYDGKRGTRPRGTVINISLSTTSKNTAVPRRKTFAIQIHSQRFESTLPRHPARFPYIFHPVAFLRRFARNFLIQPVRIHPPSSRTEEQPTMKKQKKMSRVPPVSAATSRQNYNTNLISNLIISKK